MSMDSELTTAEAELYDRQIRLWGIESQERLRAADVLIIGIRGLGSEIAKDILLSGINSLTILDSGTVTEEEYLKNFLLTKECIGQMIAEAVLPKAQALNPLVKIKADTDLFEIKTVEYFSGFTIIIGTGLNSNQIIFIDTICRKRHVRFICGDTFGMFGFTLADFLEHNYYEDQIKLDAKKRDHDGNEVRSYEKTTFKVKSKINYPSLINVFSASEKKIVKAVKSSKRRNELFYLMRILIKFRDENGRDPSYSHKEEDIKKLQKLRKEILEIYHVDEEKLTEDVFNLVFGEVASICAIIGGTMAQEVIKAVSHKEVPINNIFLLNPHTFSGKEETVGA